jgi:hypothetical protein
VLIKHDEVAIEAFDAGLLLYPILITSFIMMISLIIYRGEKVTDVLLNKVSPEDREENHQRIRENVERMDFDGFSNHKSEE